MYILALILMLKIYQTRHPDINASAHSAYMVMAVIILVGVIGVVSSLVFVLSSSFFPLTASFDVFDSHVTRFSQA